MYSFEHIFMVSDYPIYFYDFNIKELINILDVFFSFFFKVNSES